MEIKTGNIPNRTFVRLCAMKRLLIIVFVFSSLSTFSQDQEKKGVCSSLIILSHNHSDPSIPGDYFTTSGFTLDHAAISGGFFIDSTTWTDSLIYEITIPFGDSLRYSAYWHADGMCYPVDTAVVNHVVTVLEGTPFPISYTGDFVPLLYNLSQEAVIYDPCLLKIQRTDIPHKYYFIRVKFQDPPLPELPLDLPEVTNDVSLWLSNENTLSVKADKEFAWSISLYSLSGQMIQNNQMEGSQDVDISNLSKGCYIARISSENGLKKQVKFIR